MQYLINKRVRFLSLKTSFQVLWSEKICPIQFCIRPPINTISAPPACGQVLVNRIDFAIHHKKFRSSCLNSGTLHLQVSKGDQNYCGMWSRRTPASPCICVSVCKAGGWPRFAQKSLSLFNSHPQIRCQLSC